MRINNKDCLKRMQTCLDKRVIHQGWAEGQLKAYYPDDPSAPPVLKSPEPIQRFKSSISTLNLMRRRFISLQSKQPLCSMRTSCHNRSATLTSRGLSVAAEWLCCAANSDTVRSKIKIVSPRRDANRAMTRVAEAATNPPLPRPHPSSHTSMRPVRPRSTPLSMNQWPGMTHEVTSFSTYQILWHRSRWTEECGHHGPHM